MALVVRTRGNEEGLRREVGVVRSAADLNRTVKIDVDEGLAATFEEAYELASRRTLQIDVGEGIEASPTRQAILLTALKTAERAFLGGVHARISSDPNLTVPWASGERITEAIGKLGCELRDSLSADIRTISLGGDFRGNSMLFPTWNGWSGGVVTDEQDRLPESREFPLSGVLAGALATSEAFQASRGDLMAARRAAGLSLWRPDLPWRDHEAAGGPCPYLPSRLWLLGLGHLGQAFAWALGFLPYRDRSKVLIALQDFDTIEEANISTSLVATRADLGLRKTRVVAERLEALGFKTMIVERRFDLHTRRNGTEPGMALAGFDSVEPRRALSSAGFDLAVDAGIGSGPAEYSDVMIHSFPSPLTSQEAFGKTRKQKYVPIERPAYEAEVGRAMKEGVSEDDARCGIIEVAGQTVAAAFVGAATACLALAEPLRMFSVGPRYEIVDWSLTSGSAAEVVVNVQPGTPINPGFVEAEGWG